MQLLISGADHLVLHGYREYRHGYPVGPDIPPCHIAAQGEEADQKRRVEDERVRRAASRHIIRCTCKPIHSEQDQYHPAVYTLVRLTALSDGGFPGRTIEVLP